MQLQESLRQFVGDSCLQAHYGYSLTRAPRAGEEGANLIDPKAEARGEEKEGKQINTSGVLETKVGKPRWHHGHRQCRGSGEGQLPEQEGTMPWGVNVWGQKSEIIKGKEKKEWGQRGTCVLQCFICSGCRGRITSLRRSCPALLRNGGIHSLPLVRSA